MQRRSFKVSGPGFDPSSSSRRWRHNNSEASLSVDIPEVFQLVIIPTKIDHKNSRKHPFSLEVFQRTVLYIDLFRWLTLLGWVASHLILDYLTYMRGTGSLSFARSISKQLYPHQGIWGGILPSLEPKRRGNEESIRGGTKVADDKGADPIVAFSRPPPFPPYLGPLVALSLLDLWLRRDSNDP